MEQRKSTCHSTGRHSELEAAFRQRLWLLALHLEAVLLNKRSCCNERPVPGRGGQPLPTTTAESPHRAMQTQHSQKLIINFKNVFRSFCVCFAVSYLYEKYYRLSYRHTLLDSQLCWLGT